MQWIHANKVYRAMLATADLIERERIFRDGMLAPLQGSLEMTRRFSPHLTDPMDQARAMLWLMPEDLETEPDGLALLESVHAWEQGEEALARAIERFLPYAPRVNVETGVTGTIMLTHPSPVSAIGGGYAGYQMPDYVVVTYDKPNVSNISKAPGAVAHEFNHRIRLTAFPWDMATIDVAEYVVMEGLAEAFAVDLYGEDVLGFYVTQISADDLETARRIVRDGWRVTGFDQIRGYIFGDNIAATMRFDTGLGMPDFGGYAVGYHIVRAYLRNSGASIEEATLTPPHVIVAESGYLR